MDNLSPTIGRLASFWPLLVFALILEIKVTQTFLALVQVSAKSRPLKNVDLNKIHQTGTPLMSINFLENVFEKVSYLLNLLIAHATGKNSDSIEYEKLRHELLSNHQVANQLPAWIKLHRNLDSSGDSYSQNSQRMLSVEHIFPSNSPLY